MLGIKSTGVEQLKTTVDEDLPVLPIEPSSSYTNAPITKDGDD